MVVFGAICKKPHLAQVRRARIKLKRLELA
jgi:hypothetical protein